MAACSTLVATPTPIPTMTEPPTRTSTPTATATPLPTDTPTPTPKPVGLTKVNLAPDNGDLDEQLAAEAKKAAALGQMPVVEFAASW